MAEATLQWSGLICQVQGALVHSGLPLPWLALVLVSMLLILIWVSIAGKPAIATSRTYAFSSLPIIGSFVRYLVTNALVLQIIKLIFIAVFFEIIIAGLFGTPIAERNLATMLTWNLWWAGLIVVIFFAGSVWCAVCPWDALSNWLVTGRLLVRSALPNSLELHVPKYLRNVWPALLLLIGLTWLELGAGTTTNPYATALLAMFMLVLATASLAIFERKAFCRHFCPVGRTIGFYAQLAPVELRPLNLQTCAQCTTLECYAGNATVAPCPTHLVMGRLTQNTYCTSCGNCVRSCPDNNVAWRLRPVSAEALIDARPHWDEAWFMLVLLALTSFHGLTMMPFWESGMRRFGHIINDSGQLLWSFSSGLAASIILPIVLYSILIYVSYRLMRKAIPWRSLFAAMSFCALPLAFSYHLAHNLNHIARETVGLTNVLLNPLGTGTLPLTEAERHLRHLQPLLPHDVLFALQSLLMVLGFWLAVLIVRRRGQYVLQSCSKSYQLIPLTPLFCFVTLVTLFNTWMLLQPMIMRL